SRRISLQRWWIAPIPAWRPLNKAQAIRSARYFVEKFPPALLPSSACGPNDLSPRAAPGNFLPFLSALAARQVFLLAIPRHSLFFDLPGGAFSPLPNLFQFMDPMTQTTLYATIVILSPANRVTSH